MERIQALIDKLYEQKQQNSNPAQLLLTVQLLQTELLKLQQKNGSLGTSKVAVTLPANLNIRREETPEPEPVPAVAERPLPPPAGERPQPAVLQEPPLPPVETFEVPASQLAYMPRPAAAREEYSLRKPVVHEESRYAEEPPATYAPAHEAANAAFVPSLEAPTLSQKPAREVHEAVAEVKESLNDRLKQEKPEMVSVLKETPIKDLRKGIGINDRFTFVNELFRGDEAMYERSIKTINSFQILSEAEYWINRELKFKLGWNDTKEAVQHFYHLVRRRFA